MKDKLESIIDRYNTIEKQMADQEVLSNLEKLKEISKEYKQLEPIVITGKEYIKVLDQLKMAKASKISIANPPSY